MTYWSGIAQAASWQPPGSLLPAFEEQRLEQNRWLGYPKTPPGHMSPEGTSPAVLRGPAAPRSAGGGGRGESVPLGPRGGGERGAELQVRGGLRGARGHTVPEAGKPGDPRSASCSPRGAAGPSRSLGPETREHGRPSGCRRRPQPQLLRGHAHPPSRTLSGRPTWG